MWNNCTFENNDLIPKCTPVPLSGTLYGVCNGNENIVYECSTPLRIKATLSNSGICPAQVWIYYIDGSLIKRIGTLLYTDEIHYFDPINSVIKITITCMPLGYVCNNCKLNAETDHCIVHYDLK